MKGRLPKPTALKLLEGTARKDRMNADEPVPPEGEVLCPPRLKGRARKFWKEHAPVLMAMGLLTVADVPMLAQLCDVEAEYWDASDDIRVRGTEIERTRYDKQGREYCISEANPSVKIRSDAGKRLARLQVEFGQSPSSRTRVKAAPKPEKKSALEELRDRRKA